MITAIETSYAGCRFRSRLEARWAHFFDKLEMPWMYEPQGYEIATPTGKVWYLPDFWLPDAQVWVEVKGVLDLEALNTLVYAASPAGLPLVYGEDGRPERDDLYPTRRRLLLLGNVPRQDTNCWTHHRIDVVADDLIALKGCTFVRYSDGWRTHACTDFRVINDLLVTQGRSHDFLRTFVDGQAVPWARVCDAVMDAYIAASTVRFEHGESP